MMMMIGDREWIDNRIRRDDAAAGSPTSEPRPIRVMRVIARLNVGGPAIHTILLTDRLREHGFTTTLVTGVTGPREGDMMDLAAAKRVRPVILPTLGRELAPGNDARTVSQLYRLMRRERPHIVHTHTAKAGTVGRIAARLARVPVVVHTFHGHVLSGYFGPAKTRFFIEVERALARVTDRVLVLGEPQLREIRGFGIGRPEQFRCVPLGLELEPFLRCGPLRGRLRREHGLGETTPLIGIVARLVPIKGHRVFLQGAQRVAAARPEARFAIIGDGELRGSLEAEARALGLSDRVLFTGFRSDLPEVYADLDVVALSSFNEGLPVTIIEALAAARPVVATDVGAVSDLVENGRTGWLAVPGDAESLARGILAHLEDPARAQSMAEVGRCRVYPALSIDRLATDLAGLYREAVVARCGSLT
jgi:glycosyltransferase involved in cell wall biosynthesis